MSADAIIGLASVSAMIWAGSGALWVAGVETAGQECGQ